MIAATNDRLANCLRPLPWPERATEIDKLVAAGFDALVAGDPAISVPDALALLTAQLRPIVHQLDDSGIAGLDHATVLALFSPDRAGRAKLWASEHATKVDFECWEEDHPACARLAALMQEVPAPVFH